MPTSSRWSRGHATGGCGGNSSDGTGVVGCNRPQSSKSKRNRSSVRTTRTNPFVSLRYSCETVNVSSGSHPRRSFSARMNRITRALHAFALLSLDSTRYEIGAMCAYVAYTLNRTHSGLPCRKYCHNCETGSCGSEDEPVDEDESRRLLLLRRGKSRSKPGTRASRSPSCKQLWNSPDCGGCVVLGLMSC